MSSSVLSLPEQSLARRFEPTSPFVVLGPEDRAALPTDLLDSDGEPGFVDATLRVPEAIVARLCDADRIQSTVLGSVLTIIGTAAFFGMVAATAMGAGAWGAARTAAILPLNTLLAIAASLGPIYSAGILVAARVPLARLTAILLSSVATGGLVLAALSAAPYFLWRLDPDWAGPLSVVVSFFIAGLAGGARAHRLLSAMAKRVNQAQMKRSNACLSEADEARVAILARVAVMLLALAFGLATWTFNVFSG